MKKIEIEEFKDDIKMFENKEIVELGLFFVELFCGQSLHIFVKDYDKEVIYLYTNPEYTQNIIDNIIIHPNTLPMICKPLKWNYGSYGGYLENKNLQKSIITGSKHHHHKISNLKNIYSAINYLNNIKFKINKDLINYILNDGIYLLEKIKNDQLENYINSLITIKIAETYINSSFYLTHNCDWRGRIYTQSFYLDYQGSDLSTGLLELEKGALLTERGLYYLYIYGANCHGENDISKKTFEERIEWVKSNMNLILNMDKEFILKAESPFLFSAFCLVLIKYDKDPNTPINFPVSLDATCSGMQHFSGLLLDFELASQVNLLQDNKVNDVYKSLVNPINKAINIYGMDNFTEYSKLMNVKLTRRELKSLIMTKTYNVTTYGMKGQLMNKFERKEEKRVSPLNKEYKIYLYKVPSKPGIGELLIKEYEIMKIAQIVNDNIFSEYKSLNSIYKYLTTITKVMTLLEIPVSWVTPSGLSLTQSYALSSKQKLSISFRGKNRTAIIKEWSKCKVDNRKQVNSIIPNIIHSFDGSHLINLINYFKSTEISLLPIHDCFGCHPNDMDELASEVRKQFVLLYSNNNFLEDFHKKFIDDIISFTTIYKDENLKTYIEIELKNKRKDKDKTKKVYLPDVPKMGTLELKQIEKSKYMIC